MARGRDERTLYTEAWMVAKPETTNLKTVYVRFGEWFPFLCLIWSVAMLVVTWRNRKSSPSQG